MLRSITWTQWTQWTVLALLLVSTTVMSEILKIIPLDSLCQNKLFKKIVGAMYLPYSHKSNVIYKIG